MNTTSLAFIILGVGLALCAWRFLAVFRRGRKLQDSRIVFLIGGHLLGFAIQTGVVLGLGTFLFATNPFGIFCVILISNILLTLLAGLGLYTIFYIFYPASSFRLPLAIVAILGLLGFVLIVVTPPSLTLTLENRIDWGMNFPLSLTTFYLLFISIGAQAYLFLRLFMVAPTREISFLSLILGLIAAGGVVSSFLNFVVLRNAATGIRTQVYDITQGLLGVVFLLAVIIFSTLKRRTPIN